MNFAAWHILPCCQWLQCSISTLGTALIIGCQAKPLACLSQPLRHGNNTFIDGTVNDCLVVALCLQLPCPLRLLQALLQTEPKSHALRLQFLAQVRLRMDAASKVLQLTGGNAHLVGCPLLNPCRTKLGSHLQV